MKELVKLFMEQNNIPKYAFGRNQYTSEVVKNVELNGVIDEYTQADSFEGIPIVHNLSDIEKNAIVLNLIFGIRPISIQKKIENAGLKCIDFFSFSKYSGLSLPVSFWEGFHQSYKDYKDSYDLLYARLADTMSKDILQRLLNLRINLDFSALYGFSVNEKEQYFEPFLELKPEGETFVDVGGFDGNTTLEFIKRCPRYERIYFFEPEPSIMQLARNTLTAYPNIIYCQYAASDKEEILHFSSSSSASKISEKGELEIHANTIDSIVTSHVTFIKMDIEGSESAAIEGAKQIILRDHPRLAICVYHKGSDIIDIPKQVLSIRNDYNVYLRHYTEGVTETVMFFIPSKDQ